MSDLVRSIYNIGARINIRVYTQISQFLTSVYFALNNVKFAKFTSIGVPMLDIDKNGKCVLGKNLVMVNEAKFATLGKNNRCKLVVANGAILTVGNNVAMSNTTIVATTSITLGNNILIGGGVTIVDTDFHSLNPVHWHTKDDVYYMKSAAVVIGDNVFIGMETIILKGIIIGSNVVIAAGSVVSKDIPKSQIWGGNPARFIKDNVIQ